MPILYKLIGHLPVVAGVLCLLGAARASETAQLNVTVLDRENRPVSHIVVYATPEIAPPTQASRRATMVQHDHAFVPHILVVAAGTQIEFPNADDVSHHVYSFSAAKSFELPLYKGNVHAPLTFDVAGVVTLGCNIHDDMLAYILVVDTPYFTLTDDDGRAQFGALPTGNYSIRTWTPRVRAGDLPAERRVALQANHAAATFKFDGKLFPPHASEGGSLSWRDY